MFSLKSKLDINLKNCIKNKLYKNYRVIVHCKSLQNKIEKKLNSYGCQIIRSIPSIGCISSNLSPNIIERIIEYPEVDYITFDNYALLCGKSIEKANGITFSSKYKLTGKGICIGIVDTGVYPHPDLKKPFNKISNFLDIVNNLSYSYDDNGHGTFISGLICSSGYCSEGLYKGIAENSNIYMIKAFNHLGRGYISDILSAIEILINESKKYNIKILCLPFETVDYDEHTLTLFSNLFEKAIEKNMIILVPSGHNSNVENSMRGISLLKNCITIGGIDTTSNKKAYTGSSFGPCGKLKKPNLSAACVDICSLNSDLSYISERNGHKLYPHPIETPYTCYSGTSCATAYISGLCALLYENNPDLTYKDILSLLNISCDILQIPRGIQGSGMINFNKLLP
ncbi:S8 family serine peptidase [Clostridium aestuarii]|uniref:S8 family serine peptidase n=1 Tax=Clostridium aestuarii TaxID=338193 RepID=A0ABT4D208_9CLOT|nr:S8 family serine peptidase [Clostridium aestuarii]MCY6485259.1 S8 family serine peptidase [Clostridium aestuarii]